LVLLEGTFNKGYLGGIDELLYVLLQAPFAHLIKRMNILVEPSIGSSQRIMQDATKWNNCGKRFKIFIIVNRN